MNVDLTKLEADLTAEEGRKNRTYYDGLGFVTGGIGHLLDPRKGGTLPDKVIDLLFQMDVDEKLNEFFVRIPWAANLSEPRQRALVNMAFQMGVDGVLKFENMLRCLQAGEWEAAVSAAKDSAWATQTPNRCNLVTSLFLQD